jgi:hypothetical protein
MSKIHLYISISILAFLMAVAWYASPNFSNQQQNQPPATDQITYQGEIDCIPKTGTGPATRECAVGLKDDSGNYYQLANLFDFDSETHYYQSGQRVEISGQFSPGESFGPDGTKYDSLGSITISSIRPYSPTDF